MTIFGSPTYFFFHTLGLFKLREQSFAFLLKLFGQMLGNIVRFLIDGLSYFIISLLYDPRLLHCLNQMLAVVLLSQHRVSSSKTIRPRAPCGAQCIGHAVRTWSVVCSEAPHSQFGEGARPHLCMDEWNRPTPVRRRLSLTHATEATCKLLKLKK